MSYHGQAEEEQQTAATEDEDGGKKTSDDSEHLLAAQKDAMGCGAEGHNRLKSITCGALEIINDCDRLWCLLWYNVVGKDRGNSRETPKTPPEMAEGAPGPKPTRSQCPGATSE